MNLPLRLINSSHLAALQVCFTHMTQAARILLIQLPNGIISKVLPNFWLKNNMIILLENSASLSLAPSFSLNQSNRVLWDTYWTAKVSSLSPSLHEIKKYQTKPKEPSSTFNVSVCLFFLTAITKIKKKICKEGKEKIQRSSLLLSISLLQFVLWNVAFSTTLLRKLNYHCWKTRT